MKMHFQYHLERVWNEDFYGSIRLIKIELLNTASLQKVLPITNMQKCDNIMLVFGLYTSHFKLILRNTSYFLNKSSHGVLSQKSFHPLKCQNPGGNPFHRNVYSNPCTQATNQKARVPVTCRENGGGSIVPHIWCSQYPKVSLPRV